jgi:hypothetical protein
MGLSPGLGFKKRKSQRGVGALGCLCSKSVPNEKQDQDGNRHAHVPNPEDRTGIVDRHVPVLNYLPDMAESASQEEDRTSDSRGSPKVLSEPNAKDSADPPTEISYSNFKLKGTSRLPTDFASYFICHEGVSVPSQETTQTDVYSEQVQEKEFDDSGSCPRLPTQRQVQAKTHERRR